MAKGKFQVSEAVRARFAGGQRWYTGTVARVDDKKGTFSIAYDDGEHHTYLGALRDMMGRWGGRRGHRLMPYVRAAVSLRTIRRTQMCCVCTFACVRQRRLAAALCALCVRMQQVSH